LKSWPKGYERGGFRLDGQDVVIFAAAKPDMRLRNKL
jgi:hypothetical protein